MMHGHTYIKLNLNVTMFMISECISGHRNSTSTSRHIQSVLVWHWPE